jgi:hypothetical protein
MPTRKARSAVVGLGLVALFALLTVVFWDGCPLTTSATCDAGSYVVVASRPYHLGFLDYSVVCDLTLRGRGLRALTSSMTETVGSGTCEGGCGALVPTEGDQILVGETWYSADGGRRFSKVADLVPHGLLGGDSCWRFDFSHGALRVRSWPTWPDGMNKPPSRSFVSRDGGASWNPE